MQQKDSPEKLQGQSILPNIPEEKTNINDKKKVKQYKEFPSVEQISGCEILRMNSSGSNKSSQSPRSPNYPLQIQKLLGDDDLVEI